MGHKAPDDVEYSSEMFIAPSFHLFRFVHEVFACGNDASMLNKCTHDGNVYLNGPEAPQDTGKHGNPLLRKKRMVAFVVRHASLISHYAIANPRIPLA